MTQEILKKFKWRSYSITDIYAKKHLILEYLNHFKGEDIQIYWSLFEKGYTPFYFDL